MEKLVDSIINDLQNIKSKANFDFINQINLIILKVKSLRETPSYLMNLDKIETTSTYDKLFIDFLINNKMVKEISAGKYLESLDKMKDLFEFYYRVDIPFHFYHVTDLLWFKQLKIGFEENINMVEQNLKWHHIISAAYNNYILFLNFVMKSVNEENKIKICSLNKNNKIYYNVKRKILGRKPTSSNIKANGSDNSLYFGTISNSQFSPIICDIFQVKNIFDFHNKTYLVKGYNENISIITNINSDGQLQVKINGNGVMNKLFIQYQIEEEKNIEIEDVVLFVDFQNSRIFFKQESEINEL